MRGQKASVGTPLEAHLPSLDVRTLPLEETVHGPVLAPPQEHDHGLAGDRHLERRPDEGDGVAEDGDVDERAVLAAPPRLRDPC